MHILQVTGDVLWLGHASMQSTEIYLLLIVILGLLIACPT